jgi:uncharacterized protein (DUF1330 family)
MVQITVHNADEYAKYAKLAGPAVEKFGGEFLARAGKCLTKEGPVQLRNVIIKFLNGLTLSKAHSIDFYIALFRFSSIFSKKPSVVSQF